MNRRIGARGRVRIKRSSCDLTDSALVQRVRCALGKARRLRFLPYALLFAAVVALPLLFGCVAHVHTRVPFYFHAQYHNYRPHPQYYCYDCHGYTYFDPYYDFCSYFGFRFRWDRYSSLRAYHRRYYPRIRRVTPHFGEYKYKSGYRYDPRYKKPLDYKKWKKTEGRNFYSGKTKSSEVKKKAPEGNKKSYRSTKKSRSTSTKK